MLRRILVISILIGLAACVTPHARLAKVTPALAPAAPVVAPKPAIGLWAMLDAGCAKPSAANISAWPACASPFWISGDKTLVVLTGHASHAGPRSVSYSADYSLTPGDPVIAQVGTERDGFVFLALTNLARDDQGRLVGAQGAAVACPQPTQGALVIKPNLNGCDQETPEAVRHAAALALQDRAGLTEVRWIAPGAP